MKNCATCLHLKRKCDGNCGGCGHRKENESYFKTDEDNCKCLVCYDEDSGKYRYWEENKEIIKLLERGDYDAT